MRPSPPCSRWSVSGSKSTSWMPGTPPTWATFGGRLRAGYSMTGGEPSDTEAITIRLDAGNETAAISLDREVFDGAIAHEDGALTLQTRRRGAPDCSTRVMDTAGDVAGERRTG